MVSQSCQQYTVLYFPKVSELSGLRALILVGKTPKPVSSGAQPALREVVGNKAKEGR